MTSLAISVIGLIVLYASVSYIRLRARAVVEYANACAAFFAAAEKLALADDAPAELVDTIHALNESLSNPRSGRDLLAYLLDGERWTTGDEAHRRRRKILTEYFARRSELEPLYQSLVLHWFVAVTALSPVIGKSARFAMNEGSVEAAATRARRSRPTGHGDVNSASRLAIGA